MFFRNLTLYRFAPDYTLPLDDLDAALASKPARPCASQELATYGFISPLGTEEMTLHGSGCVLIAARREERILPGQVVRDALKEKIDAIEAEQERKVYKAERNQLKDEIVTTLLPRAFIRKSVTHAIIDTATGIVYVDAYSPKKAEDLLSTLREVLGTLPVRPLNVKQAPLATMTEWVKNSSPSHGLRLGDACELQDPHEDGGSVRCKRLDLTSEEVQNHLATGKLVRALALAWEDKLVFDLDDQLRIRRLRFDDLLQEQADKDGGDDQRQQIDATFAIQVLTLREFIGQLGEALGGIDREVAV